jgi:hypothetical protein
MIKHFILHGRFDTAFVCFLNQAIRDDKKVNPGPTIFILVFRKEGKFSPVWEFNPEWIGQFKFVTQFF